MALTLMSDPIMALEDAKALLDIKSDTHAVFLVNALTKKFRNYTGRVQLSEDTETDIVEYLRGETACVLYLHCSPVRAEDDDVVIDIWDGHEIIETYKYSEDEVAYYGSDEEARIESHGLFPVRGDRYIARVTYRGGWTAIPGDVLEGAILQGRVDMLRSSGEVGVASRGKDGESTTYDQKAIVKAVAELWQPYRVLL